MITVNQAIECIRNQGYMDGVERDNARVRSTGEVFTPYKAVKEYIDQIKATRPDIFADPKKNACDTSCGDGQFLGEILIAKMEAGLSFEQALKTVYGVDLMPDNIVKCRERLLCGVTDKKYVRIVEKNIVNADSLTYKYEFLKKDIKTTKELKEIIKINHQNKILAQVGVTFG